MRRLRRVLVVAAMVSLVGGVGSFATPSGTAGGHVAAQSGVTLVVQPRVISDWSQRMTIFGSVASRKANEKVGVQFRACGLYPSQFREAFETTTNPGGGSSFNEIGPLQRFEHRRGAWIMVRQLVLTEQQGGVPGAAPPFQTVSTVFVATEPFRAALPRGTTVRVVFPLAQARPCYLAGVSKSLRT